MKKAVADVIDAVKDDGVLEDVEIVVRQIAEAIPSEIQTKDSSEDESSEDEPLRAGFEWKRYLSGALSDEQLYLAMFVLFVFYFVYTLYNAFLDSNEKDEGDVFRNCTCRESHRNFYLSWSIMCFALWLVLHSCYTLAKAFPAVTRSLKGKILIQLYNLLGDHVRIFKNTEENDSGSKVDSGEGQLKKLTDQHIGQCEGFLWLQSYKLYAVGTKKRNEQLNLKEMEKLIATSLSPEICKKESKSVEDSQEGTDNGEQRTSQKFHNFHIVKRTVLSLFHSFLVFARFVAQLSVVPLLIVQMFDTYTLLCLAERDYCNRISQYRLHLDQTALSFSFYCSLMISLLLTIWLNLVSRPELKVSYRSISKATDRGSN